MSSHHGYLKDKTNEKLRIDNFLNGFNLDEFGRRHFKLNWETESMCSKLLSFKSMFLICFKLFDSLRLL